MLALQTMGWAALPIQVVRGTVKLNGDDISAEYTLTENGLLLGSGRNACISQYSVGEVEVPATVSVDGSVREVIGISDMAFRLCTQITSVILPEGVTRVGNFAFKGCRGLTRVTLPSTVESIGTGAFIDLPSLSDFFVSATTPPRWEYNDVFFFHEGGIGDTQIKSIGDIHLYVPLDHLSDYESALYTNAEIGWTTPDGWGNFASIMAIEGYQKEAYAAFDAVTGTLTFYYDDQKEQHTGVRELNATATDLPGWYGLRNQITKVVFTPSFGMARPTITSKWFYGCQRLATVEGLEHLNTSKATSMNGMFHGCLSLSALDLSHFDTSHCTDLSQMFQSCSMLECLDLSAFDTSMATTMYQMFYGCDRMKHLDLRTFDTQKVTSLEGMFYYCTQLETLHVEHFDMSASGGNGASMLGECQRLKAITLPSTLTVADNMFTGCSNMTDVYFYGTAPFTQWSDNTNSDMLMPEKATRFHVPASTLNAWTSTYPDANCTFVGDWGTDETTIELDDDATDNSDRLTTVLGKTINVKLKNHTLYKDGSWNTLCLPFDLTAEQLHNQLDEGYKIMTLQSASFSAGTLTLNFSDTTAVAAGLPFIIKWETPSTTHLLSPQFKDVTITAAQPGTVKLSLGDSSMAIDFQGVFDRLDIEGESHNILYLGNDNLLYYPSTAMPMGAFRGYFVLYGLLAGDPINARDGINDFVLNFGGETSGISTMTANENLADDVWYDLNGRRLAGKPTQKGVYISKGRKKVIQ